ncbi:hypothetical protein D3C87_1577170 [compost metagenome]
MVRTVDLNEFAKTVAAIPWLINACFTPSMWNPKAISNHPVTNSFRRDRYLMAIAELFCGECRPEVTIFFT